MSTHNSNNTESLSAAEPPSPAAFDIEALSPRQQRVVLVCDVVESVRWMEHDEDNAITRWSQFATAVRSRIAPEHGGEVIKSTGDGLMMQFQAAPGAVAAANAMQKIASEGNQGYAPERQMHLRIGIHQTEARRDAHDLYGHGVNLAARITTLAGPGEIIVTPEVRDHLTDSLDGEIEDMGECYLKHLSEPQRVYRVGTTTSFEQQIIKSTSDLDDQLTIAVLPLAVTDASAAGELFADSFIARLSGVQGLRVISRLSTSLISNRNLSVQDIGAALKSRYIVSGSVHQINERVVVYVELIAVDSEAVIFSSREAGVLWDLCTADSNLVTKLAQAVTDIITSYEITSISSQGLPTVHSASLLLSAISLMHRVSSRDLELSKSVLEQLADRHRRHAKPLTWLANWHALRVTQGLSVSPDTDMAMALRFAAQAVQFDPHSSQALSIFAALQLNLLHDFSSARRTLDKAVAINPNDPFAWLYKATLHGYLAEADEAKEAASTALKLSPTDPIRHFHLMLAASAYLGSGEFELAKSLAEQSLRLNKNHPSTYRILAIAQQLSGEALQAKKTIAGLQNLVPSYTLSHFQKSSPFSFGPNGDVFCRALSQAGLSNSFFSKE